jgi:hypothetical protein
MTLLGVTVALLIGLAGPLLMVVKDVVLPRLVLYNPHELWMSPLSHALWALPGALALGVMHRVAPRLITARVAVFLMITALCFSVLRVYGREITEWAAAILSVGFAYQLSRWSGFADVDRLRALLRRGAPATAIAIALLAGVVGFAPDARERWVQRGRTAPSAGQPNVLLIILDTARSISMSLYGSQRLTTPNIDRFAENGVTFDLAIAPSPWTLPSHASLFTGRHPHELNATWRVPLDDTYPTLAEKLTDAGYRTGAVVANRFNANSAMGLARGFDRYVDYTASWSEFIRSAYPGRLVLNEIRNRWFEDDFAFDDFYDRRTATEITDDVLRWIGKDRDRPFFAFANYFDVHDPYIAPDSLVASITRAPHPTTPPVQA